MNFVIDLAHRICGSVVEHRSAESGGSIPHGDLESFICLTLVTGRKTSFSNSLPSSKLSISLILSTILDVLQEIFWKLYPVSVP